MKKIYFVLTYTGTILSRIVHIYTGQEFCHSSLSLDAELNEMYSFGRLNPYNPFIGGFVHEGINIGTFKRFKNTKTEIYSLEITAKQYNKINLTIIFKRSGTIIVIYGRRERSVPVKNAIVRV